MQKPANDNVAPAFTGLKGVDELVSSRGLEILRERTDVGQMRALLELATIVAAHELAQMISEYVDYGQAKARMERLEQKLEVATK